MKKGDLVERDVVIPAGSILIVNPVSQEHTQNYLETIFKKTYGSVPQWEVKEMEGSGPCVVSLFPIRYKEEGEVMWVINGEASLRYKGSDSFRIINLEEEKDWVVIQEGVPSYQSSVDGMTDEQLRQAIDDLRAQRTYLSPKPKFRAPREKEASVDKNDPIAVKLASMLPGEKAELMKKLGMVD